MITIMVRVWKQAREPVGSRVGLRLLRGGQPLEVAVDIGERPASRCH